MTDISFAEFFSFCWIPDPAILAGLFGYTLFAVALITLITAPVTPKPPRPTRLPRRSALVGGVR